MDSGDRVGEEKADEGKWIEQVWSQHLHHAIDISQAAHLLLAGLAILSAALMDHAALLGRGTADR